MPMSADGRRLYNVLDQRELIVNNTHPRTLAPITYRYQDPRQFILTNTFSF